MPDEELRVFRETEGHVQLCRFYATAPAPTVFDPLYESGPRWRWWEEIAVVGFEDA